MKLWLLNHLRFFPVLAAGEINDMVGVVLGMFGAIYGIILAFVIVNLWTDLQTAETVVSAEASAVSQIARDTEAFPPGIRDAVHGCVREYVHAVVERQWPLIREGAGTRP